MLSLVFFGSDQYSEIVYTRLTEEGYPLTRYPQLPPHPTVGVLASYGTILPQSTIDQFPQGILCLHPSLLPQYRGATPVPTAIALGETTTGVTLFRLTAKIDQGEILAQAKVDISPTDTAPDLLTRLFTKGADLLTNYLSHPTGPGPEGTEGSKLDQPLIFTRRFTRQSGFIEWPVIQKLVAGELPKDAETTNKLLILRLSHPHASCLMPHAILHDLVRALTPWPGVWTTVPSKKGDLRISLVPCTHHEPCAIGHVLISGKPNPISWSDFTKYYL